MHKKNTQPEQMGIQEADRNKESTYRDETRDRNMTQEYDRARQRERLTDPWKKSRKRVKASEDTLTV